jgi:L-fuconolactonase
MRIDSHQHFWKYDPVTYDWITSEMAVLKRDFFPNDLASALKLHNIDGCISVQAGQTENETEFLLKLAAENDFVKGVVGWVDLRGRDLDARLEYYAAIPKVKGFRHVLQSEHAGFMLDAAFIRGVNKLSEYDFTYDLLIYHHQLEEALQFLAQTDEVRIVIDHLAKPSIRTKEKTRWELNLAAAGTFDNVYCKLSGMVTEAGWHNWTKNDFEPYMDELFDIFGPGRIMYGSDWPVCLLSATYDTQLEIVTDYILRLSPQEKENVMGKNAERFYNLD